ncbi:hypothetical protein CA13_07440 [Planctomycetes bacterium CA13]|uniref:Uncharacterized protein n=1 Tax=Novipirellula herctigrandis TaxID=2527986 RepID=A0A5C5YWH7_9BACT|nr:hypothetical protein CA13_07440 [Planctomycetes bacterium CA13]
MGGEYTVFGQTPETEASSARIDSFNLGAALMGGPSPIPIKRNQISPKAVLKPSQASVKNQTYHAIVTRGQSIDRHRFSDSQESFQLTGRVLTKIGD